MYDNPLKCRSGPKAPAPISLHSAELTAVAHDNVRILSLELSGSSRIPPALLPFLPLSLSLSLSLYIYIYPRKHAGVGVGVGVGVRIG